MAAIQVHVSSALTIAAFAFLLGVTLLMGMLFMYSFKRFLKLLGFTVYVYSLGFRV